MEALSVQELSVFAGDQESAVGDEIIGSFAGAGLGAGLVGVGLVASGPVGWAVIGGLALVGAVGGYLQGDGIL